MASASCSSATLLGRDLADDPHAEAGPGERLAPHHLVGQAELDAEAADLVLEQVAQRLDQLQRHVLGQPADVVVALDHGGRAVGAAALDEVGVQRALDEELGLGQPAGVLLEDADELSPIALRFASGSVTPARRSKKRSPASTWISSMPMVAAERLDDLVALALAHQPGVDVDARQLVADRRGARAPRRPPSRRRRDSAQIARPSPTCGADARRPARR